MIPELWLPSRFLFFSIGGSVSFGDFGLRLTDSGGLNSEAIAVLFIVFNVSVRCHFFILSADEKKDFGRYNSSIIGGE